MSHQGILKNTGRKRHASSSRDAIEVYCRVRPIGDGEESCAEILSDKVVQLNAPKNSKNSSKVEQVTCTFNKVFKEDVDQTQIFERVGVPLVHDLLGGKNALCFMYGITGSGKTYTMNGKACDGGVLPRCLDCIFNSIHTLQTPRCTFKPNGYNGFEIMSKEESKFEGEKRFTEMEALMKIADISKVQRVIDITTLNVEEDNNYAVFVSFVEIYNNAVFDLLEDVSLNAIKQPKPPASKILREDPRRNMFVHDVNELEVKNTEEAFTLFLMGQNRRKTALTLMNAESSRSHCVFTIKFVQAPLGPNGDSIIKDPTMICVSQLSLCDLAGSERISRTKTDGERVRQAGHINNSLMTLRSCLECLRENQRSQDSGNKVVPYRDAKLTHLFKNYFDGDGKVNMVVCLNPRIEDFDESLHVMRFAEMTQEVKVARTEVQKFDTGLTPGRGKANRQFKAMKMDDISSDTGSIEGMLPPIQMFESWPLHQLSGCSDDITLINFMKYLEDRMKLRKTLITDWNEKQKEVRKMILQLEEDNVDLTKALEEQRNILSDKERETKTYEKRIRVITEKHEALQRSSQGFESQKRQLSADLEKQKELLHKEKQEKLRIKQTLKDLTSNERLRWEKECDKRVRNKEMEMEEQVLMRNEKLKQLRSVVENLQIPAENQRRLTQIINEGKESQKEHTCCCASKAHDQVGQKSEVKTCTCSEQNTQKIVKIKKTPLIHTNTRVRTDTVSSPRRKPKIRSRSPPATPSRRNDVAPVRSKHRRSRSTDFWLNHKPSDTVGTDTVMQPVMKYKKTVKNVPHSKDLKVAPNYILTHQEEDSSGEVCTKLIKGDVLKTRAGGTSVLFTDVETLKTNKGEITEHKSVASKTEKFERKAANNTEKYRRKRNSEDESSAGSEDSWTSVETRCAVGIEGKPGAEPGLTHHNKKLKL